MNLHNPLPPERRGFTTQKEKPPTGASWKKDERGTLA